MPLYVYSDPSGDMVVEKIFTKAGPPKSITVNGAKLYYDANRTLGGVCVPPPGNWPMKCWAMGVQPNQRKKAIKHAEKMGVPTHYDANGDPEIRSRGHYNEFLRMQGFFNKDAGYGDVAPGDPRSVARREEFEREQ